MVLDILLNIEITLKSQNLERSKVLLLYIYIIIYIIIIIIIIIAFSRNERTHPNLVSQAREIEIFWTANWPPL